MSPSPRLSAGARTLHGVLDRSTSQQQSVSALETQKRLPSHTVRVLDVLSLIQDHVLPLYSLEVLLILRHLQRL